MDVPSRGPRSASAGSFVAGAIFGAGAAVLLGAAGIAPTDAEHTPTAVVAGSVAGAALLWLLAGSRRRTVADRDRVDAPTEQHTPHAALHERPQARVPHAPAVNPPAAPAADLSAVMLIDVDQYDEVYDQRGSEAADELIADIAAVVADSVRLGDKVYRYREKAFCVLLPEATAEVGQRIANRVRREVHQFASPIGGEISVSIGIAGTIDGQLGQAFVGIDTARNTTASAATTPISEHDTSATFVPY